MAKTWVQSTGTTRDWAQDDFQESTAVPEPMLHPFSIGGQGRYRDFACRALLSGPAGLEECKREVEAGITSRVRSHDACAVASPLPW